VDEVRWLIVLILVATFALAGCGGGGSSGGSESAGAPTGRAPGHAHRGINELGVSEPEGPARSCPNERAQVQREIAKLKRLARHEKPGRLGSDKITVACPR
jgi:hypothetical protein